MNIILFGPQGCGKGTQAELLAEKLKLHHMSMGDELRAEMKKGTPLGDKIAKLLNKGILFPNSITNDIALKVSKSKKTKNGIIFDGYPRTDEQWLFVKKNFKIDAAFEIHISDGDSVVRIASRRMCPKCSRNYNLIWIKPKIAGICDNDKTKLIQRIDDKPKEIKRRLKIYHRQTAPLKKEYAELGILHVVNGNQTIKKVNKDLLKILNKLKPVKSHK